MAWTPPITVDEAVAGFEKHHGAKPETVVLPMRLWSQAVRDLWAERDVEVQMCINSQGERLTMAGPIP